MTWRVYDNLLSSFALDFNSRPYTKAVPMPEMPVAPTRLVGDIFLGTLGRD